MTLAPSTTDTLPDQTLWKLKVWAQRTWVARWDGETKAPQMEPLLIAFLEEAFGHAHAQPELQDKPTAQIAEAIMAGILHSETAPTDELQAALHKITS
ncbi:MAG: hypothetical protein ACU0A6_06155 [Shimia sp.]|uniref:hypothetical protein n=1 Tax=Shimia sp. TaxID=1954381 RepID=UPI004058B535